MKCAVIGCGRSNDGKASSLSFFSFPSNPVLRKKWLRFCNRKEEFNMKTSYVCMMHFERDDFENNMQYEMGFAIKRLLKPGVIPTVSVSSIGKKRTQRLTQRETRMEQRKNKEIVELLLQEHERALQASDENLFEPTINIERASGALQKRIESMPKPDDPLGAANIVDYASTNFDDPLIESKIEAFSSEDTESQTLNLNDDEDVLNNAWKVLYDDSDECMEKIEVEEVEEEAGEQEEEEGGEGVSEEPACLESLKIELCTENESVENLKVQIEFLESENESLKIAFSNEIAENERKLAQMSQKYENEIEKLNALLAKTTRQLNNLEKNVKDIFKKQEISKIKRS